GAETGSTRTPDQTEIAQFWADGAGTEMPPGHWNHIAQDVGAAQGNTLEQNARLFALLNIAMADAGICAWDAKYTYHNWRPVTAIRNGDTDGNPATEPDPAWSSYIVKSPIAPTPPPRLPWRSSSSWAPPGSRLSSTRGPGCGRPPPEPMLLLLSVPSPLTRLAAEEGLSVLVRRPE